MIHIVGPGGAGKTTTGDLLAERLGVAFVDLDERFLATITDIGAYIEEHGYAARNVELYSQLAALLSGDEVVALSFGFMTQTLTIVPLALALASVLESAAGAILLAVNVGGDSDSVASIAGGVLGARHPDTITEDWFRVVEKVNEHALVSVAQVLALLRRGCSGSSRVAS